MLTSSTQLQNMSFQVVKWATTSAKCRKTKSARAKRAKLLFFIVKHANLWRSCCRRRRSYLSPLLFCRGPQSGCRTVDHANFSSFSRHKLWIYAFFLARRRRRYESPPPIIRTRNNEVISGMYFSKTQCISSRHCGLNEINLKIS